MGVISGVSTEITEEEIRVNVRGVRVMRVKRLPFTRDGVKAPSLSVLLTLEEDPPDRGVSRAFLVCVSACWGTASKWGGHQ